MEDVPGCFRPKWLQDNLGQFSLKLLVSNAKINPQQPLSPQIVCNQGNHSMWLEQPNCFYSVHVKDQGSSNWVWLLQLQ